MTVSHWVRPHTFSTPDIVADIAIVGAGYVGLSTAFWISEMQPDLKVVVVDRSHFGAGASGRNAGFLTTGSASFYKLLTQKWGKDKALSVHQFAEESIDLVYQQILKSSPEIKFERSNSWTLFQNEKSRKTWEDANFDPTEFKFQWRNEEEMASSLRGKFFGAYENGPEYKVNPMQLLGSIKKMLEARKIQVIENMSAFDLTPEGVSTDTNVIKAKKIVLAMNAYLPQFHDAFKGLITPRRAQMLAVEIESDLDAEGLYYDPPERVYWRKALDKTLVIGGKRLLDEAGETGDFEKLSPKIQYGLEDYLKTQLQVKYKVIHRWSGTMGFTEHELPFLTKAALAPLDTYVVGGFSGHGMGLGFRSAQEMAYLVTGKKESSFFDSFQAVKIKL